MRAAVVLLVLWLCLAAHAQTMYKWVDEKGVTHFASEPPPDGKAQKVEVKPLPPSGSQAAPARVEDVRKRALELREERLAKQKREEDARHEAENTKLRCLRARDELEIMHRARRLYSLTDRGERVYLEDKDRAVEIRKLQKAIDTHCR